MKVAHVVSLSLLTFGLLIGGMYLAALNAPVTVAVPPRPPLPATNGFPRLQAAAHNLSAAEETADAARNSTAREWTPAQNRAFVAANRAALGEAHAALRLPFHRPNTIDSLNDDPYLDNRAFRSLARTLRLAGDVAWKSGDQARAAGWYMDAVTLGRHIPNRVGLEGLGVGLACEAMGRSRLWNHLDTLRPDVAASCLARLNTLAADRVPLFVAVEEEKWSIQSIALELMTHPERIHWEPDADDDTEPDSGSRYGDFVPPRYMISTMGGYMDRLIAQSKQPYISGSREIPVPREPTTTIFAPTLTGTRCKYAVIETGDALLRTALALRVYRARTGKCPASLSELVAAKHLPAVPQDPFAVPGTPLVYRATPDGKYTLYNIAPDGRDDNGRGIVGKSTKGEETRNVQPESAGDMVAGWYTY